MWQYASRMRKTFHSTTGAFDDRTTLLTAVAGGFVVSCAYCFEISPFDVVDF